MQLFVCPEKKWWHVRWFVQGGGPRRLDNQPVPSRYYEAYASPGHGVFMDSSREGGRSSGAGEGSGGWWGQEIPTGQDHWVVDPGLEAAMADIGLDPDGSPTYEVWSLW